MYNVTKVRPLHIILPKTSAFVKSFDGQIKWMYFLIENDDLPKKYNFIGDKVSANKKKEFGSKYAYNKQFLKTKIKSHGNEATYFYNKENLKGRLYSFLFNSN